MALVHKGLAFEPVPWHAVEQERIARSGYRDSIVFGTCQCARVANSRRLFNSPSPMAGWHHLLLEACDGLAAAQPDRSHWQRFPNFRFGGFLQIVPRLFRSFEKYFRLVLLGGAIQLKEIYEF